MDIVYRQTLTNGSWTIMTSVPRSKTQQNKMMHCALRKEIFAKAPMALDNWLVVIQISRLSELLYLVERTNYCAYLLFLLLLYVCKPHWLKIRVSALFMRCHSAKKHHMSSWLHLQMQWSAQYAICSNAFSHSILCSLQVENVMAFAFTCELSVVTQNLI